MFLPLADADVFSLWPEMLVLSEFMEGMSFEETLESPNDPVQWAGGCHESKYWMRLYQYFLHAT